VKAGGLNGNHGQAVAARTGVKGGGIMPGNHAQAALAVRTGVKAGAAGVEGANHIKGNVETP